MALSQQKSDRKENDQIKKSVFSLNILLHLSHISCILLFPGSFFLISLSENVIKIAHIESADMNAFYMRNEAHQTFPSLPNCRYNR